MADMVWRTRTASVGIALALVSVCAVEPTTQAPEWHQWRGPNRDGRSPETGLLKTWPSGGPPLAWSASGAGIGYSSFSASNGRLFTMGARGGTEFIIAFDAATGERLWTTAHGQRFSNEEGDGPRGDTDGQRRSAVRARGARRSLVSGRRHRARRLDRQRAGDVRRVPAVLGPERIATGGGRSAPAEPRRPRRLDRRARHAGRVAHLAERKRWRRVFVSRAPSDRRRSGGDLLHG